MTAFSCCPTGSVWPSWLAVKIDRPGVTSIALTSEYAVPSMAFAGSAANDPLAIKS